MRKHHFLALILALGMLFTWKPGARAGGLNDPCLPPIILQKLIDYSENHWIIPKDSGYELYKQNQLVIQTITCCEEYSLFFDGHSCPLVNILNL